jgi:hypothetical protein
VISIILEAADSIGWKDLVAGGSAGAVIFVVIVFLRHIETGRKETTEAHKEVSTQFASAMQSTSKDFSGTVAEMAKQSREAHEKCIETTTSLVRQVRGG